MPCGAAPFRWVVVVSPPLPFMCDLCLTSEREQQLQSFRLAQKDLERPFFFFFVMHVIGDEHF